MGYGYSKGNYQILAETIECSGKRPGLWIGKDNRLRKLAVFSSEEAAEKFMEWLEWFMWGPFDDPDADNMEL